MLGLRVIKEGGYPIGFADAAIRNLVRVVDFLPFLYGVGLLCMLLNRNWLRLGDLAAGTLVIKIDAHGVETDRQRLHKSDNRSISIPPRESYLYCLDTTRVSDRDGDAGDT